MFRCILAELFSLGGGHALSGSVERAAAAMAAVVASVLLCLWTPWAVWLVIAVRLASIVEAGRRGRRGPIDGRWRWGAMFAFVAMSYGFLAVARMTVVEAFKIPSEGMAPTLAVGDHVTSNKLTLLWSAPARGEVVVYRMGGRDYVGRIVAVGGDEIAVRRGALRLNGRDVPQRDVGEIEYVTSDEVLRRTTRVRGRGAQEELGGHRYRVLPGESAIFDFPSEHDGCATAVPEGAMAGHAGASLEPGKDAGSCRVPQGTLFIVGDNRGNSNDSRFRGAFPVSSVRARVVGVWLSKHGGSFARVGAID
ncbi:MAG TPA: signal peptidase I [Kofleriaceae bacterium]|nr:signal peptidase I [Kofleriaceae bacterium]